MKLSEEELVKYVAVRDPGNWNPARTSAEEDNPLAVLRYAIWRRVLKLGGAWNPDKYQSVMARKSDEEVLGMIARARLEEEI